MVKYVVLDRRQAVRHWVLVPAFAGSNPAGPAKHKKKTFRSYFYAFVCADRIRTVGSHRAKRGLAEAKRRRHPAGPAIFLGIKMPPRCTRGRGGGLVELTLLHLQVMQ